MEELYEKKDILINDEYIKSIILDKFEELLLENDKLREEIQNLKYQLRNKKKAKKNLDSNVEKSNQLSFNFD